MLKQSLVYIHATGDDGEFVGCGAYIEQNLIVTCRHVWRDAGEQAKAVFPHVKKDGAPAVSALELIDPCITADGDDPDIVLLRATNPPDGLTELQVARDQLYEIGQAKALARLPTRKTDREIPGMIGDHVDEKGRRAFSQPTATGYWLEKGSSGSPIFVAGQQLAGLVSMAELGDEPQNAPIREAYVVPGTTIWPFVRAVAQREFDKRQHAIQQTLANESQVSGARELIFEIARRSGGDAAATFEQALANARAAFDEGLSAIGAAAPPAGNLGALVNDLLKKIGERTQVGDFAGGSAEADRAFAEWRHIEAERREASVAAGVRIQSEGARQDVLRRDFRAAAERYARIVELEHPDVSAHFVALRAKQDAFYVDGRDKGVNASLGVATELARLELKIARCR